MTAFALGIWLIVASLVLFAGTVVLVVVGLGGVFEEDRTATGRRAREGARPEAGRHGRRFRAAGKGLPVAVLFHRRAK